MPRESELSHIKLSNHIRTNGSTGSNPLTARAGRCMLAAPRGSNQTMQNLSNQFCVSVIRKVH